VKRAPRGQPKRPAPPTKSWNCPHPGCGKVLLGHNNYNVNKHVLKMHPDSPAILRCSMCSAFRTMKQDELEAHARCCLGRTPPLPTLPMGAPVVALPTAAVVAQAQAPPALLGEEEQQMETEQKVEWIGDVPVLPLVGTSGSQPSLLTVEEVDKALESYIAWRGQVGSTEHERVVKKAIIDSPVKQAKLRTLLRRIFSTAASLVPTLFAAELDVRLLVDAEVVQALFQHQETRRIRAPRCDEELQPSSHGVGSAAKYQLRNELRKIIVFVMSRQSRLAGRLLVLLACPTLPLLPLPSPSLVSLVTAFCLLNLRPPSSAHSQSAPVRSPLPLLPSTY